MDQLMIGDLAKQGRVHVETIRYYERQGLLPKPPRTTSGYRLFPPDALRRLRFIRQAQQLGFTLKEIKELLSLRVRPGVTCGEVRKRAEAKIPGIDDKIRSLQAMRKTLVELIGRCSARSPLSECPILESLNHLEDPQ